MTRDEIKLVVFILSALLIGALVQHYRTALPLPAAAQSPPTHGWAKPPYVLKETKSRRPAAATENDAQ